MKKVKFKDSGRDTVESSKIHSKKKRRLIAEIAESAVNRRLEYEREKQKPRSKKIIPELSSELRKMREEMSLTVRAAAEKTGRSSYYWITKIENGHNPSLPALNDYVSKMGYKLEVKITK